MSNLKQKNDRLTELDREIADLEVEMRDIHRRAGDEPLTGGAEERWQNLKRGIEKRRTERDELDLETRREAAELVTTKDFSGRDLLSIDVALFQHG